MREERRGEERRRENIYIHHSKGQREILYVLTILQEFTLYLAVFQRLHSQLTALEGDEDKTSVITEHDEDLSTLPDNQDAADSTVPPLFLHLTCTIRIGGHVHATISLKNLPTCLGKSPSLPRAMHLLLCVLSNRCNALFFQHLHFNR